MPNRDAARSARLGTVRNAPEELCDAALFDDQM